MFVKIHLIESIVKMFVLIIVTLHPEPPPACALVALTRFSSALRAKTAYKDVGYELHLHSAERRCILHASRTLPLLSTEYGVNSNK